MLFVGKELCIDPFSVEISLVLHPLSLCRLLCWCVGTAGWFARGGISLMMISQL